MVNSEELTLILLTWSIRWAPSNESNWHMGFNSTFIGLIGTTEHLTLYTMYRINRCRYNRVRLYSVCDICKFKRIWRRKKLPLFWGDLQPVHLCWFLPHQLWLLLSVLQHSRVVTGRQANGCYISYDTKLIAKTGSDITLRECIREAPGSNLSQDTKYPDVFRVFSSGSPDGIPGMFFKLYHKHQISHFQFIIIHSHYARETGHGSQYSATWRIRCSNPCRYKVLFSSPNLRDLPSVRPSQPTPIRVLESSNAKQ